MNFYRFELVLDGLNLTDKTGTRSIFVIFLEPNTDLEPFNKIRFIIFLVQMNPTQILNLQGFEYNQKIEKRIKYHWAESTCGPVA
jgi:hypothetical protein